MKNNGFIYVSLCLFIGALVSCQDDTSLVINEGAILDGASTRALYDSYVEWDNTSKITYPYGLLNDIKLYEIPIFTERNAHIKLSNYDPNVAFNETWENKISRLNKSIYCRVSFELKNKTTNEVIGYSKYFKAKAVKGNHNHRDIKETIYE